MTVKALRKLSLSIVIGGILGFAYYYFIGCTSMNCAITSNPYYSTIYGSLGGALIGYNGKNKK